MISRAENEVDSLEIVVEAEANKANRAMTSLEKKINKVAESLERCMLIAQGSVSLKGIDVDKLFSGDAMSKAAKTSGKKLADDLIKNFNLSLAGADVQNQVKSLTNKISKGLSDGAGKPYKGLSNDIEALGKLTAKNGKIARTTADDYQKLYEWIKKSGKIKISPDTAKSLGDSYRERSPLLKQKISSRNGIELDSFYQELQKQFPSILKEAYSVEDEFYQMENALKEFYKTSNSYYKPEWLEDDAYESVIGGIEDITAGIKKAKEEAGSFGRSLKEFEDVGKSFSELLGAGMDTSGLERAKTLVDDIRRGGRTEAQKQGRSDLKYPAKPFGELQKEIQNRLSDSNLKRDYSSMNATDLLKEIKSNEKAYSNIKRAIESKIASNGTDTLGGKKWYDDMAKMNQYKIAIDDATSAYENLNAEKLKTLTINAGNTNNASGVTDDVVKSQSSMESSAKKIKDSWENVTTSVRNAKTEISATNEEIQKTGKLSFSRGILDAFKMDDNGHLSNIKNLKNVFGEAISGSAGKILDFFKIDDSGTITGINRIKEKLIELKNISRKSAQIDTPDISGIDAIIGRLQQEIARTKELILELASSSTAKPDSIDEEMKSLSDLERELKKYERLKKSMNAGNIKSDATAFKKVSDAVKSSASKINKLKKSFDDATKAMRNAKKMASSALHPIKSLKSALSEDGGNNRGMSLGRMIGSSIMFSSVFGMISQIKNAIKEGSDNLAQYSSEYNKSISSMVSSLLYLKNAWAVAFAPIANVVAPYVSAFIDMLAGAINKVGQFMAALTGKGFVVQAKKAWKDYASGLDTATKSAGNTGKAVKDTAKAVKDLANYTLGIDELNVIQPNTDNGSGSGSGGSGGTGGSGSSNEPAISDMFETIEVPNSMKDLAKMFEDSVAKSDFTKIGRMLNMKLCGALESIDWHSVYKKAENFGKDLATFLNGLISPRLFYDLGATLANAINTAFHFANAFAVNFDWTNLGASLASSLKGFFENWDAKLTGETLSNFAKGILKAMTAAIKKLQKDETFKDIGQKLVDFICGIDWAGLAWDLSKFVKALAEAATDFPKDFALGIAQGIVDKICGADNVKISEIKWVSDIADLAFKILANANPLMAFTNIIDGAISQFERFRDFGIFVGDGLVSAWQTIQNAWSAAKSFFADCISGIESTVVEFPTWIQGRFTLAKDLAQTAWKFVGSWFSDRYSEIKKVFSGVPEFFRSGFQKAYDSVKSIWSGLGQFFKGIAENAFKPIKSLVNGVIKGVNWVLDKVGSTGNLSEWAGVHFANGTDGLAKNTLGIVNDQPGSVYKELIMPPNGRAFIPEGRNVMLPLQKGTKIMPAEQTKALMGNKPHFARGIGDFFGDAWSAVKKFTGNVMDYIQDPESIVKIAIDKFTDVSGMFEPWSRIGKGMIDKTFDAILNKIKSVFSALIPKVDYKASAGVEQWRELAKKALELTNQFNESNLNALLTQMQHESGGNPNAINNWDINAKRGTPSKGLMQVIDPTFHANAMAGYNTNIYDPLSNMIAAINYTVKRYGSLYNGWTARGYKGYENGGIPKSGEIYVANENGFGSEYIGNIGNQHVVANNNQIISGISAGVEHANDETNMLLREVIANQKALLKKEVSVNMDSKRVDKQISKARSNTGFSFSPA